MFTVIDRYILRQIAAPLAGAMMIGLLMLLAERMVRLLDTTLGKKSSFAVVFEMLAYLVPHYLGTAIPAALFLGLLFGFSKMSTNSEIDAFMASGASLNRLVRPVGLLAILLSLLSLAIFGWLQPHTRYAYRSVVFDVENVQVFYLAEEGVFMQAGSRTFILDKLDRSRNAFDHVFVYDDKGDEGSETVTATRGVLVEVPGQLRPTLHLVDGHRLTFRERPRFDPNRPLIQPSATEFASADTPLGKVSKDIFRPRGEDERELTLPELIERMDTPPKGTTRDAMRAELHKRLVYVVTMLILPILAVPFALGRRRSQRAFRFGAALVLIVAFHEIIAQGSLATENSGISPWLTIWLPAGLLTAFALWRYYLVCFTLKTDGLDAVLDGLGEALGDWRRRLVRRLGYGEAP